MSEVILPDELTPQDRMRAFKEDLRALDELAAVVHKKAIDGDNVRDWRHSSRRLPAPKAVARQLGAIS